MIWLTWRQQRLETAIAALLLALAAAMLVPTGLHMASAYSANGVAGCLDQAAHSRCGGVVDGFMQHFGNTALIPWLNFLPGLFGVLFAAPFILEFEHGTFRLAWTQSITRRRWLAVRLVAICATGLAAALTLTLLMTWWRQPLDHISGRMEPNVFDFEGVVPYAYTLFAIALAVAIGVVTRRAVIAGSGTLVVFFALRFSIQSWVREHYVAPIRKIWATGQLKPDKLSHAWTMVLSPSDAEGHPRPFGDAAVRDCLSLPKARVPACLQDHHIYNVAIYQPASRFWLFQGIEAGIFVALSVVLLGFAIWWVKHRIA